MRAQDAVEYAILGVALLAVVKPVTQEFVERWCMRPTKPLLSPEQVTQVVTNPKFGPTCSRCFGYKEDPNNMFCFNCVTMLATEKAAEKGLSDIAKAKALEFPWWIDPVTGLTRRLEESEICQRCKRRPRRNWFDGTDLLYCEPCFNEEVAEEKRRETKRVEEIQKVLDATPGEYAVAQSDPSKNLVTIVGSGPNGPLPMVTISNDGAITFGPNYNPDEAAQAFWRAIGNMRKPKANAVPKVVAKPEETGDRAISFED